MPNYKEYALVGGTPVLIKPLQATEQKTYFAEEGCAFNPVVCDVSGELEAKSANITANGTQTLSPTEGKIGFSSVALTTAVYALKTQTNPPAATDGTYIFTAEYTTEGETTATVVGICQIADGAVSESYGDGSFAIDSTGDAPVIAWTPSVTADSVTVWYSASVESQ